MFAHNAAKPHTTRCTRGLRQSLALALACGMGAVAAQDARFQGDIGGMLTHSASPVAGVASPNAALPYVYGDWGRFYGRVDTFGVRTLPWGRATLKRRCASAPRAGRPPTARTRAPVTARRRCLSGWAPFSAPRWAAFLAT